MSKQILWLVALLLTFSVGFSSCAEDTPTADPYENWQARNEHYIDSIAAVATTNASGNWERVLNYKLQSQNQGTSLGGDFDVNQYVYMEVLEPAEEGGIAPLFTDSVSVYYRGELINGEVFDQSYTGDLDTEVHEPTTFALTDDVRLTGYNDQRSDRRTDCRLGNGFATNERRYAGPSVYPGQFGLWLTKQDFHSGILYADIRPETGEGDSPDRT